MSALPTCYECDERGRRSSVCLFCFPSASTITALISSARIRPLMTQDLKIRRDTGRRQISGAGVRLYDGVPFGRPLGNRRHERPALDIPPRKKRRITQYEVDDSQEQDVAAIENSGPEEARGNTNQQLILHAHFNDEDSSEDDGEFEPEERGSDASDEDMEELEVDLPHLGGEGQSPDPEPEQGNSTNREVIEPCLEDVEDPAVRSTIRKLHAAFPESSLAVCKYIYIYAEHDISKAYHGLAKGFASVQPKSAITESIQGQQRLTVPKTRSKAVSAPPADGSEDEESEDPMVNYYDQHGLPPGSITISKSGKALKFTDDAIQGSSSKDHPDSRRSSVVSNKSVRFAIDEKLSNGLESTPFIDKMSLNDLTSEKDTSSCSSDESSSSEEEESDSDSIDSSDKSSDKASTGKSSSSSEEDEDDVDPAGRDVSSDSESDSSSESTSDEEPEEASSKPQNATAPTEQSAAKVNKAAIALAVSKQGPVAPGEGAKKTKRRNDRRRKLNALNRFKEKGILPAGTTLTEFNELQPEQLESPEVASAALGNVKEFLKSAEITHAAARAVAKSHEFEQRRQELLASLADGGIEVGISAVQKQASPLTASADLSMSNPIEVRQTEARKTSSPPPTETLRQDAGVNMDVDKPAKSTPTSASPKVSSPVISNIESIPSSEPSSRPPRRKLDLGAGKRLLFGSLGIKPPKTKQDEDKIRLDLMKIVRPLVKSKEVEEPSATRTEVEDDNPDAWKSKITYRAVECVDEDVELSEPPFPFVQRWDPQQRGKRKKDQRDQAQYYDEPRASKKQKRRKGKHSQAEEHTYADENIELNYDDNPMEGNDGSFGKQSMFDTQDSNASLRPDDLAPLPDNPSALPDLKQGAAKVAMTIAFKVLEMSAATKWQPQVSPYRTAIVISITDSGNLQLSLALRDRTASTKVYDEETGERLYDKFEMPDDDEEEEENDGNLCLSFGELVDPKILREPPCDSVCDDASMKDVPSKESAKLDTSVTLSSEEESAEAQFSHVTETVLDSDVQDSLPKDNVSAVTDDVEVDMNKSLAVEVQDTPISGPALEGETGEEQAMAYPATPAFRGRSEFSITAETPSRQIAEENARAICHGVKGTGFCSDVSSSIARGMDNGTIDSPGDSAAFNRLMNDMAATPNETPYSPKFNGPDASPPRSKEQPPKAMAMNSSSVLEQESLNESTPPVQLDQSSWEPIESRLESPTPPPAAHGENTSQDPEERLQSQPESLSPPGSPTPEPEPKKKVSALKVPIGRAQALWEQLAGPKSRRASDDTSATSEIISQEPALSPIAPQTADVSNTSIQYPKLSMGSSFTSQVTDHGRQPDYTFEDSTVNVDTPKNLSADKGTSSKDYEHIDSASSAEPVIPVSKTMGNKQNFDRLSDSEPELPTRNPVNGIASSASHVQDAEEEPSSDFDFPDLKTLSQISQSQIQSRTIKTERPSVPPKSRKEAKKDTSIKSDGESSDDDRDVTPKPVRILNNGSQNQVSLAEGMDKPSSKHRIASSSSQPPKLPSSLLSRSRSFQARPTQSQPIPAGSQMVDLTLSSSDSESDAELVIPAKKFDDSRSTTFKDYRLDSDDDDDQDEHLPKKTAWVTKSKPTQDGQGSRRHTRNATEDSSRTGLGARTRTFGR